jgi:aminopeptidase N
MYGQAPSSLIYLGSLVVRGEGEMSGEGSLFGGGGTGTSKFLKSVVAHEVGHQWWGSRVSNSNQRNYWFVETLAEYFSALYLEAVFGRKEYDEQVEEWRRNVLNNNLKTSVQAADSLWAGEGSRNGQGARQSLIYNKGPYAFHVLRETFGDEKFFPFLKGFTQELAEKKQIVTRDIQLAAEYNLGGLDEQGNHYNVDLEWFFDQWIRGVGLPEFTLDYSVRQTEDGSYLIEGNVSQAVLIGSGNSATKVDGKFYRGVVDLRVTGKKTGEEFQKKLVLDGESTDFAVKVPVEPVAVTLNKGGGMLARDVINKVALRN